jgi:hypothetical protein
MASALVGSSAKVSNLRDLRFPSSTHRKFQVPRVLFYTMPFGFRALNSNSSQRAIARNLLREKIEIR